MKVWSFLYPILKPFWLHYLIMFQVPLIQVVYQVGSGYILKMVIDTFIADNVTKIDQLLYPVWLLMGVVVLQEVICRLGHWYFLKSQPIIRGQIVTKAYDYVQNHSYTFFQNTPSGTITSKIKGIVTGYDKLFEGIWWKIGNPLTFILGGVAALAWININLFFFVALWCIVFFSVMLKMSIKLSKLSMEANDAKHGVIGLVGDNITNIFTIFSFGSKYREFKRVQNLACGEAAQKDAKTILYDFKFACIGGVLYVLMLVGSLFYTIQLSLNGDITIGSFAFVMTTLYSVVNNIWMLVEQVGMFFNDLGDFKSSFQILQMQQDIMDKPDAQSLIIDGHELR